MPLTMPVRRALVLLAALLSLLAVAASAHAATQIASGNNPDSVVDRDGVTHVVWNEKRTGQPDVTHYCQIPAGGTACTNAQTFIPQPNESNNADNYGPHVMVTPAGEVLVITNRCCGSIMGQPNGGNGINVVYTSKDDGATFDAGTPLGTVQPGSAAVPTPAIFDGAGRQIITIAAPTGGIRLQAARIAPYDGGTQPFTTTFAQLSTVNSYNASVVQTSDTSFAAAWTVADGSASFVRTLKCPASPCSDSYINTAANWTPAVSIPGAEYPRLASNTASTVLMYRSTTGDGGYKGWYTRTIAAAGGAAGPAQVLSGPNAGNQRDVALDTNGVLHTVFTDPNNGLSYRTSSTNGATWGDVRTLVPGPDFTLSDPRVATRDTADGFVGTALWVSQPGGVQNPAILMSALPDPSISLQVALPPGLGLPGTGGSTPPPAPVVVPPQACQTLSFAAVDVIADACMRKVGDTYIATGGLKINGLRVELGSGQLKLNPTARTITSSGATVTVKVGDTVLYKSSINWTLPRAPTFSVTGIDVGGGGDLLGFPLKGSADIKFRGGGAEIPVHLGLPAFFGGVTGDVTIRADNVAGIHLRELHVKVGDALIGPLEIKDLFFDYDSDKASWAGGATLILPPQPPGPSLAAKVGFTHGNLDYLSNELTLPGPGIVLDPLGATYLKKIRFSLMTNPLRLSGGVTINAGPTIAGVSAVSVDGDLTFTLTDPAIIRADGKLSFVKIPVANAFFELRTNGYVSFGGALDYGQGSDFHVKAGVNGWLYKSAFNVRADADVCVASLGCLGGQAVFSSTGFAACAETPVANFGAGYFWNDGLVVMLTGCDVGKFEAKAATAQAGAPQSVTFGSGLPSGFVAVNGQGAPPHVSLVGPGGVRVDGPPPGGKVETPTAIAFTAADTNTTYFALKSPAAGTWTVEPAADSAPVTGVKSANGLEQPKVTARVIKASNGKRKLTYTVNDVPGQTVTFAEQGSQVAKPLGKAAKGGSGSLTFTPADGPGGSRKIVALVSSYGQPRTQLNVTSYVAPPPAKPATPKKLKATRTSKGALSVSWSKAKNAARYEIRATLSDGRRLMLRQKATRLSIPGVANATRATITVTGLKADNTRGKKATLKVAAKKAAKPKAKKKSTKKK